MNVKRYFAKTAREALRMLKDDLGSDAVVLANRAANGGVEILALPAGDVASIAVACSSAPHAILSVAVNDGIVYARYGQTLVYSVTLTNAGNADASAVAVTALASPGLDTSALTWTCVAGSGGAACGASGVGGLADIPEQGCVLLRLQLRQPVDVAVIHQHAAAGIGLFPIKMQG